MRFTIFSEDEEVKDKIIQEALELKNFEFAGSAKSEDILTEIILRKSPHIVFLDLDYLSNPFNYVNALFLYLDVLPDFIAISRSKAYAYEVIKNNFIDYLLKPLPNLEIRKALMKISKKNNTEEKICLKSYSDYQFLDLKEVLYLKADNNTTDFYLKNGKKVSAYKTLKFFEGSLPITFIRVHNSYILNQDAVLRINFGKSKITLLGKSHNQDIPFSRKFKENVEWLRKELLNFYLMPSEN